MEGEGQQLSLRAELSDPRAREPVAEAAEAVTSFSSACFPASFLGFTEASRIPSLSPSLTFRKQVLADEMVQLGKGACGQA